MGSCSSSLILRITTRQIVFLGSCRLKVCARVNILFVYSDHYEVVDLFEARAILLGRLGRHEHALELYVYRLHDYIKAEEYALVPTQNASEG